MKKQKTFLFLVPIFIFISLTAISQKRTTMVGLQLKPVFPVSFLGTGSKATDDNGVHFETALKSGFCGGMIIRHGFTDLLSLETGISYVKRKYELTITDGDFKGVSEFRIIGYEIPVSLMVYIQLGEYIYMNASMGPCADMFASHVKSSDEYFMHEAIRNHVIQAAVLANLGWEWRTEKSGYIYIGASYHRPFSVIYDSRVAYDYHGKEAYSQTDLLGNYLTIDLRYFFPAESNKKGGKGAEE